jgi:hypothetical protein
VREAVESKAPALVIACSLGFDASDEYLEYLVTRLRAEPVETVAALRDVRLRAQRVRALQARGLRRMERGVRMRDNVAVFDVDATGVLVPRYAPYWFFPDADYSLGIVREGGAAKVTAMRNPWKEFPSVPLGLIFRKHGGGGHRRVASVYLPEGEAARAGEIAESILVEIGQPRVKEALPPDRPEAAAAPAGS